MTMKLTVVKDEVVRPLLRYHGGKWRLAPWIISFFPDHRIYTEAYGGAASVLLRKKRSYAEVYNDLDGEIVNLFRVLRNPAQARELIRLVALTPFAREEFEASYLTDGDPIEQARKTLVMAFMGFGSARAQTYGTGFRDNSTRSGTTPAHDWAGMPKALEAIVDRLRGVVIDNRPALEVIKRHDGPNTLHYVDPPYVWSTRTERYAGCAYEHEMSDEQHAEMAQVLNECQGYVIVSGYHCEMYDRLFAGWQRVDKAAHADGAKDRTESLWLSPRVSEFVMSPRKVKGEVTDYANSPLFAVEVT